MNILSLFDGMSCGQIALNRIGVKPEKYHAAEIDKHAIAVTQHNFPETIQLGDVTKWRDWNIDYTKIDLIFAGFPCQAWSVAGNQLGDRDERGMLFWVMLDIIKHVKSFNPEVTFLIENVRMKKEFEDYITFHTTEALGVVYKYMINSALVSAQNRVRFYWTNIEGVIQPKDKGIHLKDIIEDGITDRDKSYCLDASYFKGGNPEQYFAKSRRQLVFNYSSSGRGNGVVEGRFTESDKALTLTATGYSNRAMSGVIQVNPSKESANKQPFMQNRVFHLEGKTHTLTAAFTSRTKIGTEDQVTWRKLTPIECERLQTVPDNYTNVVSNTQRYRMLGNGWTVDVIAHILSYKYGL
jgi:DNA (cytosine-5)-methyltransferase 1/DNA (cytosine-5)-methyltransferase 3A